MVTILNLHFLLRWNLISYGSLSLVGLCSFVLSFVWWCLIVGIDDDCHSVRQSMGTLVPRGVLGMHAFYWSMHLCEIFKKHVVGTSADHKSCFLLRYLVADDSVYPSCWLCLGTAGWWWRKIRYQKKKIAFFSGSKIAVQSFHFFSIKRFFSCIGIPSMRGSPDLHPQHFNRKQLLAINILLSLQSKGADHNREPKMGQFWPLALAHTLPKAEQ